MTSTSSLFTSVTAALALLISLPLLCHCQTTDGSRRVTSSATTGSFTYQALDRATRQHIALVKATAECGVPKPRVVCLADMFPDVHNRKYSPHCTVLHSCGKDTGCCASEKQRCSPAEVEEVALPFFIATVSRGRWRGEVDLIKFSNHTKCECRNALVSDTNGFGIGIENDVEGGIRRKSSVDAFSGSGFLESASVIDFKPVVISRTFQDGGFKPMSFAYTSPSGSHFTTYLTGHSHSPSGPQEHPLPVAAMASTTTTTVGGSPTAMSTSTSVVSTSHVAADRSRSQRGRRTRGRAPRRSPAPIVIPSRRRITYYYTSRT